jgi:phosphoribosylamine--glycine ligase
LTRVLLIGSGAREHAIASSLTKSSDIELYAAMSSRNPGIMKLARDNRVMRITDAEVVSDYATRNRVELAVIGPEAPLVSGIADVIIQLGIGCVGPTRKLALLEGDKAFCRELLAKHDIEGNPPFKVFTDVLSAEFYLSKAGPVAIKPAGLTGGKGVKVTGEDLPNKQSEIAYAREILQNKIGGVEKLVVEERLDGEEYSLQAFVDGRTVHMMPPVQDHKRAYENDLGPNTGGMGSYSDHNHQLPFVSKRDIETSSRIMAEVVNALREETGEEYKGILYGQFMLARSSSEESPSPKLIEFNCRFGDPEAMNVLPILGENTDLVQVCERITDGNLSSKQITFHQTPNRHWNCCFTPQAN